MRHIHIGPDRVRWVRLRGTEIGRERRCRTTDGTKRETESGRREKEIKPAHTQRIRVHTMNDEWPRTKKWTRREWEEREREGKKLPRRHTIIHCQISHRKHGSEHVAFISKLIYVSNTISTRGYKLKTENADYTVLLNSQYYIWFVYAVYYVTVPSISRARMCVCVCVEYLLFLILGWPVHFCVVCLCICCLSAPLKLHESYSRCDFGIKQIACAPLILIK